MTKKSLFIFAGLTLKKQLACGWFIHQVLGVNIVFQS